MKTILMILILTSSLICKAQNNIQEGTLKVTDTTGYHKLVVKLKCNNINTATSIDVRVGTTTEGSEIYNGTLNSGNSLLQINGNNNLSIDLGTYTRHDNYFGHVTVHFSNGDEEVYLVNTGNED